MGRIESAVAIGLIVGAGAVAIDQFRNSPAKASHPHSEERYRVLIPSAAKNAELTHWTDYIKCINGQLYWAVPGYEPEALQQPCNDTTPTPSATPTLVPPQLTATSEATFVATTTATGTPTPTETGTPTAEPSATPTTTRTPSPTLTATLSATATGTASRTPSPTPTFDCTNFNWDTLPLCPITPTVTATRTQTRTPVASVTPRATTVPGAIRATTTP